MIRAGFARGSEFTWDYHYGVYWDLTQRLYREELDPSYDGATRPARRSARAAPPTATPTTTTPTGRSPTGRCARSR